MFTTRGSSLIVQYWQPIVCLHAEYEFHHTYLIQKNKTNCTKNNRWRKPTQQYITYSTA